MSIEIRKSARGYRLETLVRLAHPIEHVFAFFADATNLGKITPKFVQFRLLTPPPITMAVGTLIDYRLRIRGVPVHWQSEITAWDPPHRFVDEQRKGPYRWWKHEHRFCGTAEGTTMEDRVDYGVPGGALVHGLLVGPDVRRIFEYRTRVLEDLFAAVV